jgi:hypothetical protein
MKTRARLFVPLLLPLLVSLSGCDTLQPMWNKVTGGVDAIFGSPEESKAAEGKPRQGQEEAAVECRQQLAKPGASDDFDLCMRGKGWPQR